MTRRKRLVSEHQGRLPFGSAAISFILERRIVAALGAFIIIAAGTYTYLVVASVAHTVERERIMTESERLAGEVSRLEREYLASASTVTEAYARTLGFIEPRSRTFIERLPGQGGNTLTLRDAR